MSKYFQYFPTIAHDLTNIGQKVQLTNVLRRFTVESSVRNNIDVYHDYIIQQGDRPDTIAHKYYGDSGYGWMVLLYNEIQHPLFDWPMFGKDFIDYVTDKYGSITAANTTVHEYRKILRKKETLFNGTIIQERYVVVDEDTYNNTVPADRVEISKYDWEVEEQERKRKIRILDKRYFAQVKNELKYILRNGV